MNTIVSHNYPFEMVQEMNKVVKEGFYPSKNALARAGVRKILDEIKVKKQETVNKK